MHAPNGQRFLLYHHLLSETPWIESTTCLHNMDYQNPLSPTVAFSLSLPIPLISVNSYKSNICACRHTIRSRTDRRKDLLTLSGERFGSPVGRGISDEILQQFLLAYRTMPNPSTTSVVTLPESLMCRKLRTIHNAIVPSNLKDVEQKKINQW